MNFLICCNGRPPSKELLDKLATEANIIIAADGGAATLLYAGIKPDFITGDMDSFTGIKGDALPDDINLVPDPDQETNDLEKALMLAKKHDAGRVVICGATGFRIDHTLKNLSVLQQFAYAFDSVIIVDDYTTCMILPKEFSMDTMPGMPVSLFPISGRVEGITTGGLKYSLSNEFIENGIRDGSSNEAISERITITYKSGSLLLIIPLKWPLPF